MSISTKGGDRGKTGLWSGERIWKDDLRVESYGTIDELNSFIGEAKHYVIQSNHELYELLEKIQRDLFRVGGLLASKSKKYVEDLTPEDIDFLTRWVHKLEEQVELSGFVIPGNTLASAKLDICRTVTRRAERIVVKLSRSEEIDNLVVQYLNRLSDLLYIMARFLESKEGKIQPK